MNSNTFGHSLAWSFLLLSDVRLLLQKMCLLPPVLHVNTKVFILIIETWQSDLSSDNDISAVGYRASRKTGKLDVRLAPLSTQSTMTLILVTLRIPFGLL